MVALLKKIWGWIKSLFCKSPSKWEDIDLDYENEDDLKMWDENSETLLTSKGEELEITE